MSENRRSESDVEADDARVNSRDPDDSYVGRTAEDDPESGETGAERRAESD